MCGDSRCPAERNSAAVALGGTGLGPVRAERNSAAPGSQAERRKVISTVPPVCSLRPLRPLRTDRRRCGPRYAASGVGLGPGILLPFQRNIPHRYVRPQFVFALAVILQRLAQPAAGFAVAVAIHVADAGAGVDQAIARVPGVNPNVANA